jgi:hypothetical protein
MQNHNELFAVRYAELTTRVALLTAEQIDDLFGVAPSTMVDTPAEVLGLTETVTRLSDNGTAERTAVRAMLPTTSEIGTAITAGWPALFISEEVLRSFLADSYELASDWQPTASAVAEVVDVLLADAEMFAESGIVLATGWTLNGATGTGGNVTVTVEWDGHLPVTTPKIGELTLIALAKDNGVEACVAALKYLAAEVNKWAAVQVYTEADEQTIATAFVAPAPAAESGPAVAEPAAGFISFDRLSEILRGDAGMETAEADALIELVQMQANG